MDVKSSLEKPTWHGGEFYPELIRKSMFSSTRTAMLHNMLIEFIFFPLWLPHFRECIFNWECLFGLLFCGYSLAHKPWEKSRISFSLSG